MKPYWKRLSTASMSQLMFANLCLLSFNICDTIARLSYLIFYSYSPPLHSISPSYTSPVYTKAITLLCHHVRLIENLY